MIQRRYIPAIGTTVVVAGLAAGGFVWWHGQRHNQALLGVGGSFGSLQSAQANAGYANGQNIPLTPAPADSGGGLSAESSPTAGNLGQLSGNQTAGSSGAANSGQQGSPSGNGSADSAFDPATFSQYGKYQNSQNALFGDVQAGTGTELTSGHQATVYYKGWLTDGTLFDQSRTNASGQLQPFAFTLGAHQVIAGWEEGLSGMKVGGIRLLIIPPAVGYGAAGQGSIPPNAVLIFEVQLIAVN